MEMPQSELLYERIEILPNRETLALVNLAINVAPAVSVNNVTVAAANLAIATTAASPGSGTAAQAYQLAYLLRH